MFWASLSVRPSVRLSVCPTHGHHFSVHFSRRGTLLAGQYLYDVKANRSNGNNKASVYSCGQNFRRKWRLKVRASDISHEFSVHFSRRGTLLAGQYLCHVKAHALNGNDKGSVFSCGQTFRRKWRLENVCQQHCPHVNTRPSRGIPPVNGC